MSSDLRLSGPVAQVRRARAALGLQNAPASVDEDEELFALALGALVVPPALADGSVVCRMPLPEERDTPGDFRYAYQSAIRSYAAVGFQRVGDFSLVLFE